MPSQCPHCSQQFGDVPGLAGKSLACPSCRREFVFTELLAELVRPVPVPRRQGNRSGIMWVMGIATLCWLLSPGIGFVLPHYGGFWFWFIRATALYAGAMAILVVRFFLSRPFRR